jgi:transposase-like protein
MAKNDTKAFSTELLDQLLAGRDPKTVLDSGGLIAELKKALAERMLNAEMDVHLEQPAEAESGNPYCIRRSTTELARADAVAYLRAHHFAARRKGTISAPARRVSM